MSTGDATRRPARRRGSRPAVAAPASGVRSVVAESWLRSSAAGVDPESHLAPVLLEAGDLADYRATHALSHVFPLLYDVLGRAAVDCDCVMAVGDADGQLLWVTGPSGVMRKAETINFVEGSVWSEQDAGTNAPGMALRLGRPVHVHASEHFNRLVHPWSCAAAPITDPTTGRVLGVVDITGGPDVSSPQSLAMIRAAARMAESELARLALDRHDPRHPRGRRRSPARRPARCGCAGSGCPRRWPSWVVARTGSAGGTARSSRRSSSTRAG